MDNRLETAEEVGPKKTFRWAIDWPGWVRAGKDPELARDALSRMRRGTR